MTGIKPTKDLLSGLMFVIIGGGALFLAREFPFGTLRQMGAGFFPVILGGLILVLGAVLFISALLKQQAAEAVTGWAIRPTLMICGAVILFALTIRPLGLVLAIVLTTVCARLANKGGNIIEHAVLSIVLVVACVGIFVYGLGMPYHLGPSL